MPNFLEISPPVLEKKIFEGFYHKWAWRPSRSCNMDYLLQSRHGESAYIIEQGWNRVVNRPPTSGRT